jgi:hypothetical protein
MLTNADLMAIFNFTEDDLEANRAGHMSARQVERLKSTSENTTACGILVLLGLALMGVLAFFAGSSPNTLANSNPDITLLIFAVAAGVVIIVLFLAKVRRQSDVDTGVVASTDGKVALRMIPMKIGFAYLMAIDSKEFLISGYAYGLLMDNHKADLQSTAFRAYFAPRSKKVLSVEILDTPES